ncbi:MAG: amidase family protein [bacterium]
MTAPTAINPFARATDMMAALDTKQVSSRELVEMHIERIERLNPALNAIVVPAFDRARAMADDADARRAKGERTPLLGLPHTTKESNEVAGLLQTAGIPELAGRCADADGPLPAAVFAAGAPLLGKTNIPRALDDWQADSPNYGRTNNPWDLGLSPGGSTGGGSAALAAGLTPLEFGSDFGGSIRVPAAFCGVYGHRPSDSLWPRYGTFPMSSHPNVTSVLAVQGPLARSAHDLELALDVGAKADPGEDVAWRLELPPARHESLAGMRVAVLPAIPWVPVSSEVRACLDELASWLGQQGANVAEASPAWDWREHYLDFNRCLISRGSGGQPLEERQRTAASFRASGNDEQAALADGLLLTAVEFYALMDRRETYRRQYREFFKDWDVLLTPMALSEAFPHNSEPFDSRTLSFDGLTVPYRLQLFYPSVATFAGQGATAFPGGFTKSGMPLGLQAVGPYLEDRTPLRFAQLIEDQRGGFVAPKGYE